MILSDGDIKHYMNCGLLEISEVEPDDIQACSIDLKVDLIDSHLTLEPGIFTLAKTLNRVIIPDDIAGMIGGRSRYARRGLLVHATSSLVAPGFKGVLVLELKNIGNEIITIQDGEKIATVYFLKLLQPARQPYQGKYQGQINTGMSITNATVKR